MNDLFRFLVIRKPDTPRPDAAIGSEEDTPLHAELTHARLSDEPSVEMQRAADAFLHSERSVDSLSSLDLGDGLAAFMAGVDAASDADQIEVLVRKSFDRDAAELAQSREFSSDLQRLSDTLLALPLTSESPTVVGELMDAYRALHLVQQLADGPESSGAPSASIMRRPILLPADLFPVSAKPVRQPPPSPADVEQAQKDHAALVEKAADLIKALDSLVDLPALEAEVEPAPARDETPQTPPTAPPQVQRDDRDAVSGGFRRPPSVASSSTRPQRGRSILERLPEDARHTIRSLGDHVSRLPLGPLNIALHRELNHTFARIDSFQTRSLSGEISSVDPVLHVDDSIRDSLSRWPIYVNWGARPTSEPAHHDDALDPPPTALAGPPASHGTVKPAGIADLLVVRQHLVRYEPGEVAYVENVAGNEDFNRATQRADTTETTVTTSQGSTSTQERDTQATVRFDLNRQTHSVLESDYARIPGAPNSESYGALVQSGGSNTDASSAASNHARDVTRRAAERITREFRSQTVTRATTSFEEDVTHHFDNSNEANSKIVVYQWLDKICEVQVFSYDRRTLYDFNVPEPGAFLLRALAHQQPDLLTLRKPLPFTVKADDITEANYLEYAAGYGATGVQPPPERYVTESPEPWHFGPDESMQIQKVVSRTAIVPPGYCASMAIVTVYPIFDVAPKFFTFWVGAGRRWVYFGGSGFPRYSMALDDEVGEIPLTLYIDAPVYQCTIAIEIKCERTARSYEQWELQTHDTIAQAARQRLSEYESKWAQLRTALQLLSFGQSAERKAQMIRAELQKAALAVLSNQHFDTLGAIEHSPEGYPQAFLPNVEPVGRYVRFLEQAFEWEQMTYLFEPYFWGRKPYWIDRVLLEDNDKAFGDFLRAGSARLIVPVRPGFEKVVNSFMATGIVPSSEELGKLITAEQLPYVLGMQDESDGPDTAKPYGDSWEVRLPTTLTVVRGDGKLPQWKQKTNAAGQVTWESDDATDPFAHS